MKVYTIGLTIAALTLLMPGCAEDPSKNVPAAEVGATATEDAPKEEAPKAEMKAKKSAPAKASEAQAEEEAKKEEQAPDAKNVITNLGGEIVFIGSKVTGSHTCRFKTWEGSAMHTGDPATAQFAFEVTTDSVESDFEDRTQWSGKLDEHLRSADFFDSAKHPIATFQSTGIQPAKAGEKHSHVVMGDLEIRGTKKAISFPATIQSEGGFQANAEFSINRKDFGMAYDGKADDLIRDGVVLKIALKEKKD